VSLEHRIDLPLAGATVALLGGRAATVAAWWCGSMGADVVVTEPDDRASGSFRRATRTRLLDDVTELPCDAVSIGDATTTAAVDGAYVAISRPFGFDADDEWRSMALWARSGLASITRTVAKDGSIGQAQVPVVPATDAITGSMAALATVVLLLDSSDGRDRRIEIDQLESLCLLPMQPVAAAQLTPDVTLDLSGIGFFAANDGLVYIRTVEPDQWQRLLSTVPGLEAVSAEIAQDPSVIERERELIARQLTRWVADRSGYDVVKHGQNGKTPVAVIARAQDVLKDEQLVARQFTIEVNGAPSLRVPWLTKDLPATAGPVVAADRRVKRLRPRSNLPLDGVRVLDLTWAWAGPFATTLLADLGAEVINIELAPRPSNLRVQAPFAGVPSVDAGGWWSTNQRNKYSVGVDLKTEIGRETVHELAAFSDIVMANFSAGVVDRLGVGFDELTRINPALVYVSMSAYGATGPSSHFVGYGTQLYAAAGFSYLTSPTADTPSIMGIPIPDPISGMAAAIGAVAYLYAARRSGRGAYLDVSELEATCITLMEGLVAETPSTTYRVDEINGRSHISSGNRTERVASITDALHDDWLVKRGFWMVDPHLNAVAPGLKMAGPPFVVDQERADVFRGAPALFADTRLVLGDLLGWDDTRIAAGFRAAALH
jgi:crotonobetainyl-CoA:carnitine CoA-transferase CaiB-like acyl-CoA transferase